MCRWTAHPNFFHNRYNISTYTIYISIFNSMGRYLNVGIIKITQKSKQLPQTIKQLWEIKNIFSTHILRSNAPKHTSDLCNVFSYARPNADIGRTNCNSNISYSMRLYIGDRLSKARNKQRQSSQKQGNERLRGSATGVGGGGSAWRDMIGRGG